MKIQESKYKDRFIDSNNNPIEIGDYLKISKIGFNYDKTTRKIYPCYYHCGLWKVCFDLLTGIRYEFIALFGNDKSELYEKYKDKLEWKIVQWPDNQEISCGKGTIGWRQKNDSLVQEFDIFSSDICDRDFNNFKVEVVPEAEILKATEIRWGVHWDYIERLEQIGVDFSDIKYGDENNEKRMDRIKKNLYKLFKN